MTNQQGAPEALAHELFTAAQLAPGEGISDAVARIAALVEAQQPAASPSVSLSEAMNNDSVLAAIDAAVVRAAQQPAPSAAAMGGVDLPDAEDMAHSAVQEALSFGLSHDVIHRWMRHIQDQTVKAMLAAHQPSHTPQADSAPAAAPADTVVFEAALRAIHQAIDLIGEPDTERLRTVRRVLRGAVVVAEDSKAPQADSASAARRPDLVPGVMHCAKCKFQLNRVTLCVSDGNAYAGNNKTEPCPNGCGPLWPVTWEQEARNCWKALEEMHERLRPAPTPQADSAQEAPNAMQSLTAALKADPEYAWAWHCNLAMPIMDNAKVSHRVANITAARLMQHLFGIDTEKHPHFEVADEAPQADSQPAPVRDESAARDECKRRWLAEDEDCNLLEAYDRGWKDRAARAPADSVLEDAARLDWLEQNIFHREMDEWDAKYGGRCNQNMWVLFAPKGVQGSARKIIDAARKQGGAT